MKKVQHPIDTGISWYLVTLLLLGMSGLWGCQKMFIETYGYGDIPSPGDNRYDQGFIVRMPYNAPSITQSFSPKVDSDSDYYSDYRTSPAHDGIDIIALSNTPVLAAAPGKVVHSHLTIMRGNRVVVEHGLDTHGNLIRTEYNHLSQRLVKNGTMVARGEPLGTLGMTGLTGGFPHLHYMVTLILNPGPEEKVIPTDPHLFWAEGKGKVTCLEKETGKNLAPFQMTYPLLCR